MDKKQGKLTFKAVNSQDTAKGLVEAVFATMNAKDSDSDVTLPGAFTADFGGEQWVRILGAHDWNSPMLGKGRIFERGDEAIVEAQFNLNDPEAKRWYESIKFDSQVGEPLQEYSYGFTVLKSHNGKWTDGSSVRYIDSVKVHEVSGVLLGAGVNTRTLDIKSREAQALASAQPEHKETPEGEIPPVKSQEQLDAEKKAAAVAPTPVPAPETKAYVQIAGSWEQTQARLIEAAQELYRYERDYFCCLEATTPATCIISVYSYDSASSGYEYYQYDWTQDADGKITLANERDVELEAVVQQKSIRFSDDHSNLLKVNREFLTRSKALAALRVKEGRSLSRANRDRITSALEQVRGIATDMEALLAETDTEAAKAAAVTPDTPTVNLDSLYAESLKVLSQIQGHLPVSQ